MESKKYVAFHTGRGGRFNNSGHKEFYGEYSLQDLISRKNHVLFLVEEDEDGNELPTEKCFLHDGTGNVMLKGEAVYAMTGVLDFDGEYDTYAAWELGDLTDEDFDILYDAYKRGADMSDELADVVVDRQGLRRISTVKFYRSNAEVFTHNGCIHYEWDGEDVEEDAIREWMDDEFIDPVSIKNWADSFVSHFYHN